jgi:hypothetical protein
MAADVFESNFTRIYNGALRDQRISFKAKGILAMLSTHRDGFGLTLESIAAFSTDGVSSVRAGLAELAGLGYLQREPRRSDGTDGKRKGTIIASDYWITDMPDGLTVTIQAPHGERQTSRSAPSCENRTMVAPKQTPRSAPSCDFPQEDNPHAENPQEENRTHKKTTFEEDQASTKQEDHHQEGAAVQARPGHGAEAQADDDEFAALDKTLTQAEKLAASLPGVEGADTRTLVPHIAAALSRGWQTARLHNHLVQRCDLSKVKSPVAVYAKQLVPTPEPPREQSARKVPPPCPDIHDDALAPGMKTVPLAGRVIYDDDGKWRYCPDCNPKSPDYRKA